MININEGHTSNEYNEELQNLRDKVLKMSAIAEENFQGATKSLLKGDIDLARSVASNDYKVNALEVEIDEDCSNIMATRNPKAGDLRNILATIKLITDLERIGDESEKIAKFATKLCVNTKSMTFYSSLKSLVGKATEILSNAIDCYARLDDKKALEVIEIDSELDEEFYNLNRILTTYLLEDVKNIEDTVQVMWCARSIERVGDHAKNICQYVVYITRGNDIRHLEEEK
jgi:phosphate transport system protein